MRFNRLITRSLFLLVSVTSTSAWAGILVEPYAGYQFAGSLSSNNVDLGSYDGVGLGIRGGLQLFDLVFAAVDYSNFPSMGFNPGTQTVLNGGTTNNRLGLVAGVSIPLLPLRFWVGFNFLDKLNNSGTSTTLSGNSFKVGGSFKLIPLISFNLEYFLTHYGTRTVNGTDTVFGTGGDSATGHSLLVSASLPLSL